MTLFKKKWLLFHNHFVLFMHFESFYSFIPIFNFFSLLTFLDFSYLLYNFSFILSFLSSFISDSTFLQLCFLLPFHSLSYFTPQNSCHKLMNPYCPLGDLLRTSAVPARVEAAQLQPSNNLVSSWESCVWIRNI